MNTVIFYIFSDIRKTISKIRKIFHQIMLDAIDHSSIYFTQSGYGMKSAVVPAVYIIIGFASTWVIFRKRGEKEDIF